MARVICSLPNASELISGVKFTVLDDGRMISAEIDDAQAARFVSIKGYELDEDDSSFEGEDSQPETPAPKLTKAQQKKADAEAKAQAKAEEDEAQSDEQSADAVDAASAENESAADAGDTEEGEVF